MSIKSVPIRPEILADSAGHVMAHHPKFPDLKEAVKPEPSMEAIVQRTVDALADDAHETTGGYYKYTIFLRGEADRIVRAALTEYADALKEQK